jgi:hypothetical protein
MATQGTWAHKGNHEVNFEYSSFKTMLVTRDAIGQYMVIGDLAPLQVPSTCVAVPTPYNGASMRTTSEITATAAITTTNGTTQHNTTQHSTTQHNTTQHNTAQHNTTQQNKTQRNTTQHNTTQHNTTIPPSFHFCESNSSNTVTASHPYNE